VQSSQSTIPKLYSVHLPRVRLVGVSTTWAQVTRSQVTSHKSQGTCCSALVLSEEPQDVNLPRVRLVLDHLGTSHKS